MGKKLWKNLLPISELRSSSAVILKRDKTLKVIDENYIMSIWVWASKAQHTVCFITLVYSGVLWSRMRICIPCVILLIAVEHIDAGATRVAAMGVFQYLTPKKS